MENLFDADNIWLFVVPPILIFCCVAACIAVGVKYGFESWRRILYGQDQVYVQQQQLNLGAVGGSGASTANPGFVGSPATLGPTVITTSPILGSRLLTTSPALGSRLLTTSPALGSRVLTTLPVLGRPQVVVASSPSYSTSGFGTSDISSSHNTGGFGTSDFSSSHTGDGGTDDYYS